MSNPFIFYFAVERKPCIIALRQHLAPRIRPASGLGVLTFSRLFPIWIPYFCIRYGAQDQIFLKGPVTKRNLLSLLI
jgi:hypothetical protein